MEDSSGLSGLSMVNMDPQEFTLEDTLGVLKDLKLERDEDLEHIYDVRLNNQAFTPLNGTSTLEKKHQQFIWNYMNQISNDKLDDYPIMKTLDIYTTTIAGLADEIQDMQERIKIATENLKRKNKDISRLKEKKAGFEKMKEACLSANKIIASKTYEQELQITNRMFKEVRSATHRVVAELFPNDDHVKDFLATLCTAYFSQGTDIYIDLAPHVTDAANFLFEAGLIVYHPYDENKVRLLDLYLIYRHLFFYRLPHSRLLHPFYNAMQNQIYDAMQSFMGTQKSENIYTE